ncbi:MAG: hypothetical protein AAGB31_07240 [Bdellovibrio sp.]
MKFIYILEDDERTRKDLYETLKSIDPHLHIRFFLSLAQFHDWLKVALKDGAKALAQGGQKYQSDNSMDPNPSVTDELRLVIAKNEFLGVQNMGLLRRARDFFIRKKMCSEQEPTALILTAFDSPDFDIGLAEERIINNVIFKPFDKLILKQHIEYALTGHHPVQSTTVASMQIHSTIEMLKEVPLNTMSEVGFTTLNNHEIPLGSFSKYYSEIFRTDDKKSLYAYCKSCMELSPKEYLCEFHFFGADSKQISQIRRHILQNKGHQEQTLQNAPGGRKIQILVLDEDENAANDIKATLMEKMGNAQVYVYTLAAQMLSDIGDKDTVHRQQLPEKIDLVFASIETFEVEKKKRWEKICQSLKDRAKNKGFELKTLPDLYITSRKKIPVEEIKDLFSWAKEVFFLPFDKSYVFKKLLLQQSTLLNKESASLYSMTEKTSIKVANPVEITQISEAGLILKYYRSISIGSFREFILWRPKELETPEIIGTVNFNEKDKGGGAYFLNHFVFFGMKDHYLKHIRLWLLDAYIKTKDPS